jgi:hypothetical protein
MAIITADELIRYMSDITLTPRQLQAVEDVIDGVQAEMETFLNRSIEPATRTETLTADHLGRVWPLHTPVISISAVQAGTPLATIAHDLLDGVLYAGSNGDTVTVTYVGGIGETHRAHPHLRLEAMRIVAREITKLHDDTLGVKDLSATDDSEPIPSGLQDTDRARLRRWKRRVVV